MGIDCIQIKSLLAELLKTPMNQKALQERTGMCNSSIGRWMRVLRGNIRPGAQSFPATATRIIYVAFWKQHGTVFTPYWTIGLNQIDAKKPRRQTQSVYNARYKERKTEWLKAKRAREKALRAQSAILSSVSRHPSSSSP